MKILIFAHSASAGGAENALRHLVNLLRARHEIHVVLPVLDSHEGRHYQTLGLRCIEFKIPIALPNVPQALLRLQSVKWAEVTKFLGLEDYGLVISNTLAILHGCLTAQLLNVPHITYVHEFLDDPELLPIGLSRLGYLRLISEGSVGLLGCSKMVLSQFDALSESPPPRALLAPFDFTQKPLSRPVPIASQRVLQVIGVLSHRKNVVFATTVAKALKVLGQPVKLEFIGNAGLAATKLGLLLRKRDVDAEVLPHQDNPYERNLGMQVVTLVCARSEPFGLTSAESLRLGVPVVASRSGGPEEILSPDRLFNVDDIDGCVRILLSIWSDYEQASSESLSTYKQLQQNIADSQSVNVLLGFVEASAARPPAEATDLKDLLLNLKRLLEAPLGLNVLTQSLQKVAAENGVNLTIESLREAIELERRQPGRAVTADVRRFGVVPFGMSVELDQLYRQGLGLAIELAATFDGPERLNMAVFIASSLWQAARTTAEPLTILALGDGVGIDSIRLASAGFTVHYMDYEQSNMAKVAACNFDACVGADVTGRTRQTPFIVQKVEQKYDAVVCLEVIEHVSDPEGFIAFIADALKPEGLVYISDCFNGIEDRWPTHLVSNEMYAGQLPFLMHARFTLIDCNQRPYAKPYVFRKRPSLEPISVLDLLRNRDVMTNLVRHQLNLGGV